MTESELLEYIYKLQTAFGKNLSDGQVELWSQRFTSYRSDDFGRAIEHIIRTRERFPQLATVYSALREVNADSPGSNNLIPAHPFCSYIDEDGHTSVWWNKTGQAFGNNNPADDAPEEYSTKNGTARLFDVSGDDKKAGARWKVYMKYQLELEALLDGMVKKAAVKVTGLNEDEVEERKKELLGRMNE